MNDEEKRAKYQVKKSSNARRIKPPFVPAGERGNLDAVVSLRFSGYELALLRKESKSRNIGLSALIRELVVEGMERKATQLTEAVHQYEMLKAMAMPVTNWTVRAVGATHPDNRTTLVLGNPLPELTSTN